MDVETPKPGKYVIAVSGGVDSMVLLNLLANQPGIDLVVAHLDHGIRGDSAKDLELVELASDTLSVPFVCQLAKLGSKTNEAKARKVRYEFLNRVKKDTNADGIITAHHQDDLLETAILNMLRGTGRKGLTSLGSSKELIRPLLNVPKKDLIIYAKANNIVWREDSTNNDEKYLRNYVRHNYVTKLDNETRQKLLNIIKNMQSTNEELDALLVKYTEPSNVDGNLDRRWFRQLSHNVSREVMAAWFRSHNVRDFDSKTLERLVVAAKTGQTGKTFPVVSGYNVRINKDFLVLIQPTVSKYTREKV